MTDFDSLDSIKLILLEKKRFNPSWNKNIFQRFFISVVLVIQN